MLDIWIWQRIITPHMSGLAIELARLGCRVTYLAEQKMNQKRAKLGWQVSELTGVRTFITPDKESINQKLQISNESTIHICQGLRGNGLIGYAETQIRKRGGRLWIIMETLNDAGIKGLVRRLYYTFIFYAQRRSFEGVLANGYMTTKWVLNRGMIPDRVFPFAYFLTQNSESISKNRKPTKKFRFIFVGNFIERKRIDLLIQSLSRVREKEFELVMVGDGPLKSELQSLADMLIPGKVFWLGLLPSTEVAGKIESADCLVLPSHHDGWGAVISEALIVGTPVICSDRCGAAGVVRASGAGGVFSFNDPDSLFTHLSRILESGPLNTQQRRELSNWAESLGAPTGAKYLIDILSSKKVIMPPWETKPRPN